MDLSQPGADLVAVGRHPRSAKSPAAPMAFPTGSETTDTSRVATDPTPRMPIWRTDTGGRWCCHASVADHCHRWNGACIWQHMSTGYAHAASDRSDEHRSLWPALTGQPRATVRAPDMGVGPAVCLPSPTENPSQGFSRPPVSLRSRPASAVCPGDVALTRGTVPRSGPRSIPHCS